MARKKPILKKPTIKRVVKDKRYKTLVVKTTLAHYAFLEDLAFELTDTLNRKVTPEHIVRALIQREIDATQNKHTFLR